MKMKGKPWRWKRIAVLTAVLCVLAVSQFVRPLWPVPVINLEKSYAVAAVVDGDTIRVREGEREITVRLLGIDAPESVDPRKRTQCFGKESSDELRRLLNGQTIRLAMNPKREAVDRYGRTLACVYRDDGLFVNEYLIAGGYAREYTYGSPYSLRERFKKTEATARAEGRGLWKECSSPGS